MNVGKELSNGGREEGKAHSYFLFLFWHFRATDEEMDG